MMLVQYVCHFVRLCHIMSISVCSKSGQDPSVHQFHRRRTSAGIAHVGFRIVYHHCVRLFDQIHLMTVDINAMSKQCLFSQDSPVHQTIHDPLPIMFQTMMQIFDSFCHMDMISHAVRLVRCSQLHRLIRNRKLCMHSHHARDHAGILFSCMTDKLCIFHNGISCLFLPVTIRDLIA